MGTLEQFELAKYRLEMAEEKLKSTRLLFEQDFLSDAQSNCAIGRTLRADCSYYLNQTREVHRAQKYGLSKPPFFCLPLGLREHRMAVIFYFATAVMLEG